MKPVAQLGLLSPLLANRDVNATDGGDIDVAAARQLFGDSFEVAQAGHTKQGVVAQIITGDRERAPLIGNTFFEADGSASLDVLGDMPANIRKEISNRLTFDAAQGTISASASENGDVTDEVIVPSIFRPDRAMPHNSLVDSVTDGFSRLQGAADRGLNKATGDVAGDIDISPADTTIIENDEYLSYMMQTTPLAQKDQFMRSVLARQDYLQSTSAERNASRNDAGMIDIVTTEEIKNADVAMPQQPPNSMLGRAGFEAISLRMSVALENSSEAFNFAATQMDADETVAPEMPQMGVSIEKMPDATASIPEEITWSDILMSKAMHDRKVDASINGPQNEIAVRQASDENFSLNRPISTMAIADAGDFMFRPLVQTGQGPADRNLNASSQLSAAVITDIPEISLEVADLQPSDRGVVARDNYTALYRQIETSQVMGLSPAPHNQQLAQLTALMTEVEPASVGLDVIVDDDALSGAGFDKFSDLSLTEKIRSIVSEFNLPQKNQPSPVPMVTNLPNFAADQTMIDSVADFEEISMVSASGAKGPDISASMMPTLAATPPPTSAAASILPQVQAAILSRNGSDMVEVTLDPPELGRIRIDFTVDENGDVKAVLAAERSETLDHLKRNIDALAQHLKQAGFGDTRFEFSRDSRDTFNPFASQSGDDAGIEAMAEPIERQNMVYLSLRENAQLDLLV